jgi:NAD(P)-dependent dehydrogenase (short-subunit alcohol dehydrogenase family)
MNIIKNKSARKCFMISGVTSGMGQAFLELVKSQGHCIIAIVRKEEKIRDCIGISRIIECDFSKPEEVKSAFEGFNTDIDAFINFAAVLPGISIFDQNYKGMVNLFNVNVITPMLIIKQIHNRIKKGGSLILLGSISAQKGSFDDPYAATKGAVHSLVKSLSLKFAPDVRVIGVAPGITRNTRMTEELVAGLYEENVKKVPLKTSGEPTDIANLILFLIGDNAKFMTGCIVDINGGQNLR